jgi:hypothetical protein
VELTAREKANLAYKQRVYELALERKQALEAVVDDGYRMPTNYGEPAYCCCCICLAYPAVGRSADLSCYIVTSQMLRQMRRSPGDHSSKWCCSATRHSPQRLLMPPLQC